MISRGLACCAMLLLPPAVLAGDTVAVLSSGGGAYMEAFSAFRQAYGENIPYFNLANGKPELPPGTVTVAAFGGKAANYAYPPGLNIIYCLAPSVLERPPRNSARAVKISLIPGFSVIFSALKSAQPALRRLTVFWMIPDFSPYAKAFAEAGEKYGISVTPVRVTEGGELPAQLRRAMGNMDAFWIPPDPLIVTQENLAILREFSWDNAVPFYGSTKGMSREGAVLSVGLSFREMGAAAAAAARSLSAGESPADVIFPAKPETTVNSTAVKKCGLTLPASMLEKAEAVYQ